MTISDQSSLCDCSESNRRSGRIFTINPRMRSSSRFRERGDEIKWRQGGGWQTHLVSILGDSTCADYYANYQYTENMQIYRANSPFPMEINNRNFYKIVIFVFLFFMWMNCECSQQWTVKKILKNSNVNYTFYSDWEISRLIADDLE